MSNVRIKESIPMKIADILRQEIMLGILKKGDMISETPIANEFGVSRGPVREAFQMLVNEGLLKSLHNGRTVINGFSLDDVEAFYRLRQYIETQAVSIVLREQEDASFHQWIDSLKQLIEKSSPYLGIHTDDTYNEMDIAFHIQLVSKADRGLYTQIWGVLANLTRSVLALNRRYLMHHTMKSPEEEEEFLILLNDKSHIQIVEAIEKRDLDLAMYYIKKHVENGIALFSKIMSDLSEIEMLKDNQRPLID